MASISSIGVGSGLDLSTLLENLQAAEDLKLTRIQSQQESYTARLTAYSQLKSAVEAVQKAAEALGEADTLNAVKSATTSSALTVATAAGAVPGTYEIAVTQLASAERLQSQSFESRTEKFGSGGTLDITIGDQTHTIQLDSDTSLDGVAKAINSSDDAGVYATVISDGNGNNYLMLTSKTEGTQGAVQSITVQGNDELAARLGYTAGGTGNTLSVAAGGEARDALLSINGIEITSSSNTIDSAIDGITLTLTATTDAGKPATVTVSRDTEAAIASIESFVTAYNALQTTIGNLTAFDVEAETQSALTGDGTVRNIQSSMAASLRVVGTEGTLRTLSQLGITTNPTNGQLTLDKDVLGEALASNPADVARLFSGSGGLAERVASAADGILSDTGSIKARTDGISRTIKTLEETYERTELSIETTMEIYRKQFTALDALVAQMNSTSEYLTQQFAALSSSN